MSLHANDIYIHRIHLQILLYPQLVLYVLSLETPHGTIHKRLSGYFKSGVSGIKTWKPQTKY